MVRMDSNPMSVAREFAERAKSAIGVVAELVTNCPKCKGIGFFWYQSLPDDYHRYEGACPSTQVDFACPECFRYRKILGLPIYLKRTPLPAGHTFSRSLFVTEPEAMEGLPGNALTVTIPQRGER